MEGIRTGREGPSLIITLSGNREAEAAVELDHGVAGIMGGAFVVIWAGTVQGLS